MNNRLPENGSSWLSWSYRFESFAVATMAWFPAMAYLCHKWPWICSTCLKHFPILSSFTGFVTRLTRRVPLVEQELPTHPEHLSASPIVSGICITRSFVLCICYVDRCLSFCSFYFGHCVVCFSPICKFWLPFWYLLTLLT